MADKKISALTPATTPLDGSEVLPIVQGGSTVKVAVGNLTTGRSIAALNGTFSGNVELTNGADRYVQIGSASNYNYKLKSVSDDFQILDGAGSIRLAIAYPTGNITVGQGNLVIGTAAKGIDFSANTPATGMTSELLNWYEEGNYTPTVAATTGSITSYTATAYYTRIGRQVTVTSFVTITNAGTGAATLTISLPFTASGSIAFSGTGRENAVTGNALQANITAGGTVMNVVAYNNLTVIATNAQVRSTVTYFV
jgi:hypothetical protein